MMVDSPPVFFERCAFAKFHAKEYITLNMLVRAAFSRAALFFGHDSHS
jgi:hypothetical protein